MIVEQILLSASAEGILVYLNDDRLAYKSRSGGLSNELKQRLVLHKAEIVQYLRQQKLQAQTTVKITAADPQQGPLPLSFAQQRLWVLDQIDGGSSHYHMPAVLQLDGSLDVAAAHSALQQIVARHAVLRTIFLQDSAGEPYQQVQADAVIQLAVEDVSTLTGAAQQSAVQALVGSMLAQPFDLSRDLMLRASLIKQSEQQHVLVANMHHIASDGWSMAVLVQEFAQLYRAAVSGTAVGLAPLPVQYSDYARWQRDYLQGEVLAQQLDYWQQQLADVPVLHSLPLERARPQQQSFAGGSVQTVLDAAVTAQLKQLCQAEGATLFMGLHALFSALLARYSNETEIVLGSPVANREQAEVAGLIGFFVNTLVLRSRVDAQASVQDLVRQSRETCLGAYAHQQVPFEKLVEVLQVERSLSHHPLFQVMLVLQNNETAELALPGLQLTALEDEWRSAKFDLTLNVAETDQELLLSWEYSTELFSAASIQRMAVHFNRLVSAALAAPEQSVHGLALLDASEVAELERWNETAVAYPAELCIQQLFEQQVAQTPAAVAVVCGDEQLSYAELECRANQLAHHLRAAYGVGADTRVGICQQRSLQLVVSVLAVLKAGGAYVPLDVAYPSERLGYICADAELPVVLCDDAGVAALGAVAARLLHVADLAVSAQPVTAPECQSQCSDAAYVIYTSGSTGQPKGVVVEHRNVVSLVLPGDYAGLGRETVMLGNAPISFDAATFEWWGALLHGGRLVMHLEAADVVALMEGMRQAQVNTAWLTSGLFDVFVQQLTQPLPALRYLLVGGDVVNPQSVQQMQQRHPALQVINGYGPTENTTFSTTWALGPVTADAGLPIGKPLPNRRCYVLNSQLQRVPVGVVGELYVAGAGLARGYLNRPALTEERFIANPFGAGRLYRTGDLVRYRAEGALEYLGRNDFQLKIRGYRIEAGEIEAALQRCGAEVALVSAQRDSAGHQVLVGYYQAADLAVETLRQRLSQSLPAHLVPSWLVQVGQFKLSANGKIDRKALPAVDLSGQLAEYEAPATATEQQLAEIWQQLLGVPVVGRQDNFFTLGGHSLLATRLASQIRQQLGVSVVLRHLFEHSVLAMQAALLDAAEQGQAVPAIAAGSQQGQLPLSFAQQRLWVLDQIDGGSSHYHMPAVLQLDGSLDVAAAHSALQQIVARHAVLRTIFLQDSAGEPYQQVQADAVIQLAVEDVSTLTGAAQQSAVQALVGSMLAQPFDLSRDLMLRASLIKQSEQQHVLVANMHHIASDGWSMAVLVQEFAQLYRAAVSGRAAGLAPLPVQYSDYARWQRDYLQGEVLAQQLDYWQQQLADVPVLHSLPLERARPQQQSFAGGSVQTVLDAAVTAQLKQWCQAEGATLFMGLHALFSALLARYSNETEIVLGSPVANREQAEVAGLIGFFVNTLVLRSRVDAQASVQDLVRQSRETCLGAYAHQQVPFEKLVEVLQVERSLSHHPLFQVMLVLQNNETAELALPGLQLTALEDEWRSAKFDLTLNVAETDQELLLSWEYSTELFSAASIQRMAVHFNRLVSAALAAPEQSVHGLALLDASEVAELERWNETAVAYPAELCIQQLFEQQVAQTPAAVAVVCGDEQLSYAELECRANQLAHHLRAAYGVGADTRVGICQQRSLQLVVSVLAVLKAGGAYVPLDVAYPSERLGYICADAELPVVLCDDAGVAALGAVAARLLHVADLAVSAQPVTAPECQSQCSDAAYVIYTSGSTGQPKGVVVEHRNVVSLVLPGDYAGLGRETVMLGNAPISFDAATFEWWGALLHGGRLVMHLEAADVVALMEGMRQAQVNTAWLTSGLFDVFVQQLTQPLPALRYLLVGGDVVNPQSVQQMQQRHPALQVINGYGPTENTTFSTTWALGPVTADAGLPIGKPLPNRRCYVLNSQLQRVPVGVVGELYVAGAGLARGYLNRPALTEERFIANPFGAGRLYRTGDLVRYRAEGALEYLGRNDFQLKIRGYRIEAGEIEAALQRCGAEVALVSAQRDSAGHQVLVGYYQAADLAVETLRQRLSQSLPAHLVPSWLVQVGQFKLSANGKIDRKALPAVDLSGQLAEYEAPATATEQQLAEIWQQLLGVPVVGRQDNFFTLGGHSLLATRLASQIRQQLGVSVVLRHLFEHSVLAMQAALLDAAEQGQAVPAIAAGSQQGQLPLSFAQQRLWVLDQIDGGSSHYHMPAVLQLDGSLDVAAAHSALQQIVARHAVLRTIFLQDSAGEPYQQVQADAVIQLAVEDVSTLTGAAQQSAVQALVGSMLAQPFDLSRDLMLRASLIKQSEQQHVLVANMHHIASDGWSMAVLVQEFAQLYRAAVSGTAAGLAPLPVQYSDYARWQRDYLQGEVLAQQLDYWQQQLADVPVLHSLPLERARPQQQSFAGGSVQTVLDAAVTAQLKQWCQAEGATLFMGLHALFSALLARYSNETEIVLGSPVANREQAEVAGLIGFFVNTLVLRSRVDAQASVQDLVRQSRETCLGAYAHQQVPFEKLVEVLQVERSLSHHPLFQVMLVLQNNETAELALPGLQLTALEDEWRSAKFDLTLNVAETDQELLLSWEYSTELFSAASIQRMAVHFNRLVSAALAAPEQSVHGLALLDASEVAELERWNETAVAYPAELCIQQLFEQQVAQTPAAVAVVCGDEQLSYAELECRANQLAHHLRAAYGVGADTRVGICQQRSLQLVVSVLAVLKAGGAYVPLDVAYPSERLGYICADAELPVVLCDDAGVAALGAVAARLLHVADLAVSAQPVTAPECQSQCSDAAYVIYTSGSTGQPKGVVVEHRNVVSLVLPGDYAGLGRETVMLGNAPISFDAATFEWWGALLHGGRLVMHLEAADVVALMEGMRQAQVNTAWLTSGLFDVFVQQLTQPLPALRYLLVGGDVVNPQSVQQMQQRHPALQVINGYGPTENTTFSTTWALGPVTADAGLPIGKPLPNRRCYVLNSQLQRVPVGVVGELYVAGAGLARGYLNRPALTEERFIANPFGAGRLYRTGDLVRYRAEGALEYLGRNDFQLKIRGYRIEAGEIEAALQRCGAEVALVSAQRDSAGHQVLVGYYQAADLAVETLRQRLSQSLPAHLVPSWLVQVGQFKLSANGKIDRKALPAVDLSGQLAEYEAPATATEQQLAEIWQQLLGVPVVGRQDNFFTLGGHSLLATRLVALISQRFARQLPYRLLFETATIAAIAEYLTTAAGEMPSQESCLVSLNHGKEQQPLFVVPGAGGHVFSLQQVAQHYGPNRMVYGLEATGLMTDAEPLDSVTAIASQNIAILKAVQPEGPYHLMGHSFGGVVAFEMACQLGQQVASLTLLDSMAPQLMADQPMADDESLLAQIVTVLLSNRGLSVAEPAIRFTDITETDQVNSTLQLLATHGVMFEPAWFRRFFQVYKAHLIAYRTYQATPFVGKAKLLLLKSEFADPTLPDYGWALWLPATLQISSVPGDHFEMLRDAGAVSICSQWQQLQQGSKDLVHQQRLLVAE